MRYGIVIEKAQSNYSAYVPDLPGCVPTGATIEEIEQQIKEAISLRHSFAYRISLGRVTRGGLTDS
jgi:predicted RNase H-like HicB family nuclease